MIKNFLSQIALLFLASPTLADSLPLEGLRYHPDQIEIVWKATTNELPKRLWVYKVIPQKFSDAVVSNAMAIGSFQPRHLLNPRDKNQIQFQDKKHYPTRSLKIIPASGSMSYENNEAKARMTEPVEGVPDKKETAQLARDYLLQLGIDVLQIMPSRGFGMDETRGRMVQGKGEVDIQVVSCGVSFVRRVDGIPFYGLINMGGFWIEFGNNAKVARFDLLWRNLLPHELCKTASSSEIIGAIKQGKTVMQTANDLSKAKKLTITEIKPYYLGAFADTPQESVYPIASLRVTTVIGDKEESFELLCPLVKVESINVTSKPIDPADRLIDPHTSR